MKFAVALFASFWLHPSAAVAEIYSLKINKPEGIPLELDRFKGKPMLVVNIATRCGYTGQLSGLQELHEKYEKRGLVVIGVPSNDFGGQTPENPAEVKKFCKANYGVSFALTEKVRVKGPEKHPLMHELVTASNSKSEIVWNFEKFLIGKNGKLIKRYGSSTEPDDPSLVKDVEAAL